MKDAIVALRLYGSVETIDENGFAYARGKTDWKEPRVNAQREAELGREIAICVP